MARKINAEELEFSSLYLIKAKDEPYAKIGITNNTGKRFKELGQHLIEKSYVWSGDKKTVEYLEKYIKLFFKAFKPYKPVFFQGHSEIVNESDMKHIIAFVDIQCSFLPIINTEKFIKTFYNKYQSLDPQEYNTKLYKILNNLMDRSLKSNRYNLDIKFLSIKAVA